MRKIVNIINDALGHNNAIFLGIILAIFSLLRLPSVLEPYWYGDEGIYETIGIALNHGRLLYSGVWDNKPPMLYLIYQLFNGDLFWVRLASLIFGFFSVVVFFALARKLFKNQIAILVSTLFFTVIFATPVVEANVANAENFILLPILLAFYLTFEAKKRKRIFLYFVSGLLLSFAFLIKIVALFDLSALLFALFVARFLGNIRSNRQGLRKEAKKAFTQVSEELYILLGFIIPILFFCLYFLLQGSFGDFLDASFFSNIGYVGYENFFIVANGLLYIKLGLLIFWLLLVFHYRKKLGAAGVLVFAWTAFELFSAFFSHRPYTHYLMVFLPSASLLLGYIIEEKIYKVGIPLVIIIFIVVNYNFNFYKKIGPYYANYFSYLTTGSVNSYQNFFDKNTVRDYDLAQFIKDKTNKNDNVFLWGDSAQIYALSGKLPPGRFTVAYHITQSPKNIEETKQAVAKAAPKYIIQTKKDDAISNFLTGYELRYVIDGANIYEKQF